VDKVYRLRKNKEFRRVYNRGRSTATSLMVLVYLHTPWTGLKVGFSVTKKVGNAVVRNRVRRRIKEAVRVRMDMIKDHVSIVFVARPAIVNAEFSAIEKSVETLLRRAELLKKGNQ
jgi:ribonuclease P protein component